MIHQSEMDALHAKLTASDCENDRLRAELAATQISLNHLTNVLNTPCLEPFADAVVLEAKHQVFRWGTEHDAEKTPFDWFWTIGYLAQKAAAAAVAGDLDKALHHTISTAALLANWHRHLLATSSKKGRADA